MSTDSTHAAEVDWATADAVAAGLGLMTRKVVAEGDAEAAQRWCLMMTRTHTGEGNALRSLSYFELAVVLGHREPKIDAAAGLKWGELVVATQRLAAAVKAKAAEDDAARANADAEKKAAEQSAKDSSGSDGGVAEVPS